MVLNHGSNLNLPELDRGSVQGSGLGKNRTVSPVQGSGGGGTFVNPFRTGLDRTGPEQAPVSHRLVVRVTRVLLIVDDHRNHDLRTEMDGHGPQVLC